MDKNQEEILVVGYGGMGRMYANALRKRCIVAGVVVGRQVTCDALSKELDEPGYTDVDEAVRATEPSAIAVFSPTEWHAANLRVALKHKIPSMVIKPACVDPEQAQSLFRDFEAAGVPLLMAHEGVFAPAFLALEAAVLQGMIGAVREVHWVKEGQESLSGGREKESPRPEDLEGRNYGHVYASVMHELYVVNRLLGRLEPENCDVGHCFAASHEMKLDALVRYPGGLLSRIRYNLGGELPFRRGLQVVGEKGSLLWLVQPGQSVLQLRQGKKVRDIGYRGRAGGPAADVIHAFLELLDGGGSPESLEDGARALRAARKVTEAAASAAEVAVNLSGIAGGADLGI